MKHLVIKNLGPLKEVDIELDDLNVIIGAQSTGKSCVLKMACYCSWVEKRIMLTQALDFYSGKQFINDFVSYYKMHGYIKPNTYVLYESPYLKFDYQENKQEDNFTHIKKKNFWQYKRPKLTYVPTERNVVSLFPDFEKLPNTGNHIQDFMIDWKTARNYRSSSDNILGMGFDYRYDKASNTDFVTMVRGSNLSTAMDIAAHGCPIDVIYKNNIVGPPNSPWAALDSRFGLELGGYLSHIACVPENGYDFRYYTHDPWWLNSPWFDRYGRSPHDIYLPLAVTRMNENGKTDINNLVSCFHSFLIMLNNNKSITDVRKVTKRF